MRKFALLLLAVVVSPINLRAQTPSTSPPSALITMEGDHRARKANRVRHAERFDGSTADEQITNCLAAIPSGGTCDATGYGATTQLLASQVTVGPEQTLLFDPSTVFQASYAALNAFNIRANARLSGLHFDCGNQPGYSGTIFTFADNYGDGDNTTVENIRITCSGVTTGTAALFSASGPSQSIAFVTTRNWRVFGLQNGHLLTASGNGWVNGNHFIDMEWSFTTTALHLTNNNGQLYANICSSCDYQAGKTAWVFDGTSGPNDQASGNLWIGNIWDAVTPIAFTNTKAVRNLAIGFLNGTISDPNSQNNWLDLSNGSATLPTLRIIGKLGSRP
jgi:hypothetical protein